MSTQTAPRKMTAFRILPADLEQIDRNAEAHGMTRTAWIIRAALEYTPENEEGELDAIRARLDQLERVAGL